MHRIIASLGLLLALGPGVQAAEDTDAALARDLLGAVPVGAPARACFVRVYDAAHLVHHPQQQVTRMILFVSGERDAETKTVQYAFRMAVGTRETPSGLETSGSCGTISSETTAAGTIERKVACSIDCDGGGVNVTLAADTRHVRVAFERISLWHHGADDAPRQGLEAGADDRLFLLERTKLADCLPLAATAAERAEFRLGR